MNLNGSSQPTTRPVWLPPLVGVATLFTLFASAMAVRRSPIAEVGRPVMVALSTIAAAAIAAYGSFMIVQGRVRGLASVIAGCIMVVLGLFTGKHVLR